MPNERNYWVTKCEGGWQVKKEGGQRASSIHNTQEEAWNEAIRLAKLSEGEAMLTGLDGKIRKRNSYGNDPHPPRG